MKGIREDVTAESLAKLTPAFSRDGSITAGSSSPDIGRRGGHGRDEQGSGRHDSGSTVIAEIGATRALPAQTHHCSCSRQTPSTLR